MARSHSKRDGLTVHLRHASCAQPQYSQLKVICFSNVCLIGYIATSGFCCYCHLNTELEPWLLVAVYVTCSTRHLFRKEKNTLSSSRCDAVMAQDLRELWYTGC